MIGLPFANLKSPELQERVRSLMEHERAIYYENMCMRAVNQAIGRVIRHSKDYANILLVDERYSRNSIQEKLPKWIRSSLSINPISFGHIYGAVARFFKDKKRLA